MKDPRVTGISSITGTVVSIRHASGLDREIIAEQLAGRANAEPGVAAADVVVAQEGDRYIGFGILDRSAVDEGTACLTLHENGRRRGIGRLVLQHLLDRAPVHAVVSGKEGARYLERAGFRRVRSSAGARRAIVSCQRQGKRRTPAAVYERVRL